jgi:hypothetical protein
MIRTGRLNSFSLGIICMRERTIGNKSSFRRKKAGRALGDPAGAPVRGL